MDARPGALRNFLAYSLKRLGTDYIDIYRPARLDPAVPIEDTVGAIGEMIKAGYIRHAGLSEVSANTIRRANAVCPICDVQLEYSLMSRGIERTTLPALRELGIGVTAYGVLSRGLIADKPIADLSGIRGRLPRFQGENYVANRALVVRLAAVARRTGYTTSQLAIAWVGSRGGDIVPLIGTRSPQRLEEAIKALDLALDEPTIAEMEEAIPAENVQGTRYDAHQMAALDSEGSDRPQR
jgi:aryl-alcohol dehydrogenase-like predicted oxidoreductase